MKRRLLSALLSTAALSLFLTTQSAWAQEIQERTIKISFGQAETHPQGMGAKRFADLVAAKSGGKLKVRLFGGGQLGGDLQTLSAMQGGTMEMTVTNAGLLSGIVKDFEAVDLPFLFNDPREADAVMDGPFGKMLYAKLADKGLVGLAYWELGFRNLTNAKRPVTRLEDLNGMKIRVVQTPVYINLFNALGANAVPLPWPELYGALEQKAVDGQENPASVVASAKFFEVQKYMSMTRHIYNPQSIVASKKFWDKLSETEKKILLEAAAETTPYQRSLSRESESVAIDALKKAGMQVNEISPTEIARIREKVKPMIEKQSAPIKSTVESLFSEIAKIRSSKSN